MTSYDINIHGPYTCVHTIVLYMYLYIRVYVLYIYICVLHKASLNGMLTREQVCAVDTFFTCLNDHLNHLYICV